MVALRSMRMLASAVACVALTLSLPLSSSCVAARRQFADQKPTDASVAAAARVVHGAHSSLWVRQQRADPTQPIAFKLTLHTHKSVDELDALVQSVSDVSSPQYGQFLAREQLHDHYAPSAATTEALRGFLATHNDNDGGNLINVTTSAAGDSATWRMTVETAEKLFETSLFEYHHRDHRDQMRVVRSHTDGFSVPSQLEDHVVFIDGLEAFPTPRQAQLMMGKRQDGDPFTIKSLQDTVTNSDILTTPGLIRAQYDIPDHIRHWNGSHPANTLVVSAFLNEYYTENDLESFLHKYEPRDPKNFQFPKHTGDCIARAPGSKGLQPTGEASLDIQVTVSLSRSDNIEMLCFQDVRDTSQPFSDGNQEPFLKFMETVNAMDPLPSVVSVSYTDEECAVPSGYRDAVNRELMKAALQGITIVISAGDGGVQGGRMTDFCGIPVCSQFIAMFPASSPYVTAVGATSLTPGSFHNGKYAERVTCSTNGDLITSGGGFSAVFTQPAYQKDAVKAYLELADQKKLTPLFNAKGRAYPDLSALGHAFPVYQNGQMWRTDGTSVSAPIVASLISLLNKKRLEKGLPVLGFFNPLLYKLYEICPHVFQDITEGSIACGRAGASCCTSGHEATKGWDAASGVGTIKFAAMAQDLQGCIEQIQDQGHAKTQAKTKVQAQVLLSDQRQQPEEINLLQQKPTQVEQAGAVVTLVAAVALLSVLFSMRGKLFPGRRLLDLAHNYHEPAREYLLAGQE